MGNFTTQTTQLDTLVRSQSDNLVDFSVKESVHAWNRIVPVSGVLATAETPQDLYNIVTENANRPAAVNLFTNPSFENSTTGITNDGAPATRVTTTPRLGTYSLQLNPANSAALEGAYATINNIGGLDTYLVASIYVRDASDADATVILKIQDSDGTDLATSDVVNVTDSYQRLQCRYLLPAASASYRIWFGTSAQHNTNLFFDSLQVEHRQDSMATEFIDPINQINCSWQGTADASYTQRVSPLSVIKGFRLTFSHDTLIGFDTTADVKAVAHASRERSVLVDVSASAVWEPQWPLDIRQNISFTNGAGSETPTVQGVLFGRSSL
jgi:hypothetical protein